MNVAPQMRPQRPAPTRSRQRLIAACVLAAVLIVAMLVWLLARARTSRRSSRHRPRQLVPIGCVKISKTSKARCSRESQAVGDGAHLGARRLVAGGLRAERRQDDSSMASTLQRDVDAVVSAADAYRWDAAIDALDQLEADVASARVAGELSDERAGP